MNKLKFFLFLSCTCLLGGDLAEAHELMKPLLLILEGLHVLGALYHQFVLKNGLIDRMKRPV